MRRLLSYSLALTIFVFFSCRTGNHAASSSPSQKTTSGDTVFHDTINKKVEIRHTGPDQRTTDSIKDAKTRKKK